MKNLTLMTTMVVLILSSCQKNISLNSNTENTSELKNVSLRSLYVVDTGSLQYKLPFHIGAAINSKHFNDSLYKNTVIKEYNSITCEGAMKMSTVQAVHGVFNFTDADSLVSFAQHNGKRVHGHTLVWGTVPSWVQSFSGDSAAWENLMKTHIQTVVTHFKGKVASWDVVNEAVDDYGLIKANIWQQHLGNDYIARAFIYAHQSDSVARLFYNDFGHEYSTRRRDSIVVMLNRLVARGIPVHGIGLQMHTRYNLGDSHWSDAITAAASTGLLVHIAELDVSMNPNSDPNMVFTTQLAQEQGQKFQYIVHAYNQLPIWQKFGITTWNVADKDTWIRPTKNRPDWPLPFNDYYQRKPAYWGIINGAL